jgi:F1F0 ATPase subunit 2
MINWVEFLGSVVGGIGLGLFYFGGLWWTVNRIQTAGSPVAIYLTSLVLRGSVVLICLFLILQAGVLPMLAAMVGFVMVRLVLVRRLGFAQRKNTHPNFETKAG